MRKLTSILLCVLIFLALTGCKNEEYDTNLFYKVPKPEEIEEDVTPISLEGIESDSLGTQADPYKMGELAYSEGRYYEGEFKLDFIVHSITKGEEAESLILENNPDDASSEGYQYVIINISVKLLWLKEDYSQLGGDISATILPFRLVTDNVTRRGVSGLDFEDHRNICRVAAEDICNVELIYSAKTSDDNFYLFIEGTWVQLGDFEYNEPTIDLTDPNPEYIGFDNAVPLNTPKLVHLGSEYSDSDNNFDWYSFIITIKSVETGVDVDDIIRNAWENNEPAKPGYQYCFIELEIKLLTSSIDNKSYTFSSNANLLKQIVDSEKNVIEQQWVSSIEHPIDEYTFFIGSEFTGVATIVIKIGENSYLNIQGVYFELFD